MFYLQALRFEVCWVQLLNLNQSTLSFFLPIEARQADRFLPKDVSNNSFLLC